MQKSKISIIIPAYNEENNIKATLKNIVANFRTMYEYEIIVVCDGCKDKTEKRAREVSRKNRNIRVFSYHKNQGKGQALKFGVDKSNGNLISFFDAGGDFDVSHVDRFTKLLEVFDADIVIGSKRHPASKVNYPRIRRFYSYIYHLIIRLLFNLNIKDTQTGIKIFKKQVLKKIIPRVVVKKYAFDLELLVIAKRLGYNKIFEAPVNLNYNFTTSGIDSKTIYGIFMDTLAIFYRLHFLKYYDKILNKKTGITRKAKL